MNQWKRIERWLESHAPKLRCQLLEPVSDEIMDELETTMSITLPLDVIDLYRVHNGQYMGKLDGDWQILPMEAMIVQWGVQKRMREQGAFHHATATSIGPVRPVWWSDKWIPFGYNGTGDLRCIDLDPMDGAQVGQIVAYWHNRPEREWLAGSLSEWFERFADDLEAGRYVVESELILRRRP